MFWESLLCARWVEARQVIHAVATAFGVPPTDVVVIDDVAELLGGVADRARVIVRRFRTFGEFQMQLTLLPQDTALAGDEMGAALALCRALRMPVLLPDDGDAGNERWFALHSDGAVERVQLDGARLDQDDIRVVRREASVKVPALV